MKTLDELKGVYPTRARYEQPVDERAYGDELEKVAKLFLAQIKERDDLIEGFARDVMSEFPEGTSDHDDAKEALESIGRNKK